MPPDPLSAQLPQREPLAVTLDVLIDAAGRPLVARVVTTSSDTSFDRASIDAAMRSTYSAGKTKCAFVTAHYTFDETLGAAL
jgi:outer membrane biosynthesis protein TonB